MKICLIQNLGLQIEKILETFNKPSLKLNLQGKNTNKKIQKTYKQTGRLSEIAKTSFKTPMEAILSEKKLHSLNLLICRNLIEKLYEQWIASTAK